ncbi:TRAP transporter large permease [Breoghania sp.]|uniref:TRAP transporter large permease n=1 Tax=Breoghania sp. TaxID=2065378 RepID=UPI00260C4FE5|nr:TRAP transporter large permease [Breoghania sp.]MDJ0932189.1 TRAP transporter large permease [Breoghania sp.]
MDNSLFIGLGGLGVLLTLIVIRVSIAYSMIVVGLGAAAILSGPQIVLYQLKDLAYAQFSIYDVSVVPMFVLMGNFASRIGLSRDFFNAANAWLERFRGGVAMAAVATCAGFGAICDSSFATASTMGQAALPELRRLNYAPSLATGTLAAGGTLGILIPPSVVLVIYAIIVEANIVTMFMASLVPDLLAMVMFMIAISIYCWLRPSAGPVGDTLTAQQRRSATIAVVPVLTIFVLVIGGIYAGAFNPTPAAAVGALLVALYGLAHGRMNGASLIAAILDTAKTTGMIYLILLGAELLKIFLARGGVPQAAADAMLASGLHPYVILLLLLFALIILGCLMDGLSMILLAIPFFWPVLTGLDFGMDEESLKIWFGVIALVVVELGLITPPVGLNVFIINALARDVPMIQTFRGVFPFFLTELVRVALLICFPTIILFLPHLLS